MHGTAETSGEATLPVTPEMPMAYHHLPGRSLYQLDARHLFYTGSLPMELVPSAEAFETLWIIHPDDYHGIMMHGRSVKTPRWQQAYGADYHYTGKVNRAMPVPAILEPLLEWCQATIDRRLNGLLLNWYDAELGHYIGKHRDSTTNMIVGAPIVTISFGGERVFRLRHWPEGLIARDFSATAGRVFVMPYDTNQAFTHEVPYHSRMLGRRISVTLRALEVSSH